MTVDLLERAASALGPLLDEVVFVGGATISLWITDPAAPPPRPTDDVDVIVEVANRGAPHDFEQRMRERGFREDVYGGVICRWRHGDQARHEDLILDAMPTDANLMGFANRWQAAALPHAAKRRLPSGITIRAVTPAYLVATKLEAFNGRGHGNHLASRDLEDVICLIDGRDELPAEIANSPDDVRTYIAAEIANRLTEPPRQGRRLPDAGRHRIRLHTELGQRDKQCACALGASSGRRRGEASQAGQQLRPWPDLERAVAVPHPSHSLHQGGGRREGGAPWAWRPTRARSRRSRRACPRSDRRAPRCAPAGRLRSARARPR